MDPCTKISASPRWTNGYGRAARSSEMSSRLLRAQFLTMGAPRGWGNQGDPHHGVGGRRGGAVWPGDGGSWWRPKFQDGAVFGAQRMGVGGRIGCSGEMGCSWVLYVGRGRLAEAAEERSRWQPVELNGAVVLSLESVSRGRGNRGAVKLQKGKGRQRGSGAEAALGVTAASRMGSGGAASDRRTEMKEERAEWAAKAGWGR
jgi:hypothetical protein